jgi:hypothetical protein
MKTPRLSTVRAAAAAGLLTRDSVVDLAMRHIVCRRHRRPVKVFDGPHGGLCETCIAERTGGAEELPIEEQKRRLGPRNFLSS